MSNSKQLPPSIQDCIVKNLEYYIASCDGQKVTGIYDMVLMAIEKPMLQVVMQHCNGNQSAAAEILGVNRNTLRKKLLDHNVINTP